MEAEGASIAYAIAMSAIAGAATGVGALPALAMRRIAPPVEDAILGTAAGIMLAAAVFSLLLPGLEVARDRFGAGAAVATIAGGMALGALALWAVHRALPHEHFLKGREGPRAARLKRAWLLVFAIGLHNVPEGLAVGVSVAGEAGGVGIPGLAVTLGIAVQNMPEGLVVALALATQGYRRRDALATALATGLVEPLAGALGAVAIVFAAALLPWGLAVAAGAMLYVISGEMVPETHQRGNETVATMGLMAGFVAMMALTQLV